MLFCHRTGNRLLCRRTCNNLFCHRTVTDCFVTGLVTDCFVNSGIDLSVLLTVDSLNLCCCSLFC